MEKSRKSYRRGKLSTVDLLVLTSLVQLLFILKIFFTFFTKQVTLMRRSTVQSLPPQLVFPGKILVRPKLFRLEKKNVLFLIFGDLKNLFPRLDNAEFYKICFDSMGCEVTNRILPRHGILGCRWGLPMLLRLVVRSVKSLACKGG